MAARAAGRRRSKGCPQNKSNKKPRISPGPSVIRENDDPYPRELRARGIRPLPDKPFAMAGVRKYRRSCHFIGTLRAITKGRNLYMGGSSCQRKIFRSAIWNLKYERK